MKHPILFGLIIVSFMLLSGNLLAEISMDKKLSLYYTNGPRMPALNPHFQPWIISSTFGGGIGYGFNDEVMLFAEFDYSKIYNDLISEKIFKIGREDSDRYWKVLSPRLKLKYSLIGNSRLVPYFTAGVGLSIWSINDEATGEKMMVTDSDGQPTEYSANELFFSGGAGYEWFISEKFSLNLDAQFNYLTGIGANFSDSTNDFRSRAYADIKIGISYYFNLSVDKGSSSISYDDNQPSKPDKKQQDAVDYDQDGVPNALDLCPNTPVEARSTVDEYGCPADSDADGLADYLDRCPMVYADITVDPSGCPADSDADMVPDSLDQCPRTPVGYAVDKFGCPNMDSIFSKRILHIEFTESGRGVDFRSVRALDSIAAKLIDFPDVKVVIKSYTDNSLYQSKSLLVASLEADKIKSFLIERKISGVRIESTGMGAVDFIDTNSTSEGRQRNRRIEISYIY